MKNAWKFNRKKALINEYFVHLINWPWSDIYEFGQGEIIFKAGMNHDYFRTWACCLAVFFKRKNRHMQTNNTVLSQAGRIESS